MWSEACHQVLRPLGRDSGAGEYQMLPVTDPGLPVRSYKQSTFCDSLCRKRVNVGGAKMPAGYLLGPITETASGNMQIEVGSQ